MSYFFKIAQLQQDAIGAYTYSSCHLRATHRASPAKARARRAFPLFHSQITGKGETCSYTIMCTCGAPVYYTDHVVHDVILSGLYDIDIRAWLFWNKASEPTLTAVVAKPEVKIAATK